MVKTKIKRAVSFVMATVLSLSAFMSIGTSTAFAASGEKTKVYMVDFPRDGDANYDGVWGHSNLTLKNGWHTGSSTHTNLKAIGSYSGNIAYCIEPGVSLSSGQSMNKYDENYFNNITANGVISGDEIRLFIGRILQHGYRGTIKKTFGLWIYKEEKKENIRCLCSKCLKDYIHNPDYIVRRLDPFAKVKDHCDKCNQSGWDYVIAERQHNAREKGCQNV